MTLIHTAAERIARQAVASGALAPLADSLAADLERLLNVRLDIPRDKARLSRAGFQVTTGSACSSGGGASEVLTAMGVPPDSLRRVLRISSLRSHTAADWQALAAGFAAVRESFK